MTIYGDGETSRDFCFVANAVQANLRAAMTTDAAALNEVYNVAVGERTTLNGLFETLAGLVRDRNAGLEIPGPAYEAFRVGDVRHSQADIGKAQRLLVTLHPTICAPDCSGAALVSLALLASRQRTLSEEPAGSVSGM